MMSTPCGVCRDHPTRCAAHPRLEPAARRNILAAVRRARTRAERLYHALRYAREHGAPAASLDSIEARALAEYGRARRLLLSLDARHCAECGARFPEHGPDYSGAAGYATQRGGRAGSIRGSRICYACSTARERAAFAKAERYCAYLSRRRHGPGFEITTWTGDVLADVESLALRRVGFGGERVYFRARALDGSRWHGNSPGPGMFARLYRSATR